MLALRNTSEKTILKLYYVTPRNLDKSSAIKIFKMSNQSVMFSNILPD